MVPSKSKAMSLGNLQDPFVILMVLNAVEKTVNKDVHRTVRRVNFSMRI